jgi:phytoene dehydrogenase-like protein
MVSKKNYDAIIIGGGHNGLVCAAYLAKAGRRVLVLERRHVLGGAAVTEELYPGFKYSVCSYVVSLFRPQIMRDLNLSKHGMQIMPLDVSFSPYEDGRSLARWDDAARTREEIAAFSAKDAEIYPEFGLAMSKMARFVKNIIDSPAPKPDSLSPKELLKILRLGKSLNEFGPEFVHQHAQLLTMSAVDFLEQWFESDQLISPMAVSGIIGTFLGINSPGTAYVLLHHYMGEIDGAFRAWGFSKGGTGQVSLACASAARSFGAEILTDAAVKQLKIVHGQAKGVVLANGDEIDAKLVISSIDPHHTFMGLVGESELDDDFKKQLKRYKFRGSSGKINLALDHLPEFKARRGYEHLRGDVAIAPSTTYLEKAYDEAKYGEYSKRPYMNIVVPSLTDPSVAPPGKHVMSIFVQYAPYNLNGGAHTWDDRREEWGDQVLKTLEEFCPGIQNAILHRQVITPWDLEQTFGLKEGNIFHGELSLEQLLFQRPVPGWANYKTPIRNLWMCGSGTHPGGGLMGGPGQLSARSILEAGVL